MFLEAILTRDDLARLLAEIDPVTVHFNSEGTLSLTDISDVSLVPDAGLRVRCKARLRWAVAGIPVPVTLRSLTALLRPGVVESPSGDALALKVTIEDADLAGLPDFLDGAITERINRALESHEHRATWEFTRALTRALRLPEAAEPLDALELSVAWGQVRVNEEAMVLAVSLHAHVVRRGEVSTLVRRPTSDIVPRRIAPRRAPRTAARAVLALTAFALVAGVALGAALAPRGR